VRTRGLERQTTEGEGRGGGEGGGGGLREEEGGVRDEEGGVEGRGGGVREEAGASLASHVDPTLCLLTSVAVLETLRTERRNRQNNAHFANQALPQNTVLRFSSCNWATEKERPPMTPTLAATTEADVHTITWKSAPSVKNEIPSVTSCKRLFHAIVQLQCKQRGAEGGRQREVQRDTDLESARTFAPDSNHWTEPRAEWSARRQCLGSPGRVRGA